MTTLGFGGETAQLYRRYRRGYPRAAVDLAVERFGLTEQDVVVDVGCGTGQLALPFARRVGVVVGVDPEPDMLAQAREAAGASDVESAVWVLASDADLPTIGRLVGEGRIGAVTIGQALHWMNSQELFRSVVPFLRPGGGVAVFTNGTPLWLQDTEWSRALRSFLEGWLDRPLSARCGTDAESHHRYRQELVAAGFHVTECRFDESDELDLHHLAGGVLSAMPVDELPRGDDRAAFMEQLRNALPDAASFREDVRVTVLLGSR